MNLTVVIPCRNEVNHIEECIRAIYNSNVNRDVFTEVIVVDGISNDGTIKVLNKLKLEFSSLKVLINEKQLTPYAFNLGIKAAFKPDFIQIVGARQILGENYLKEAMDCLISNPIIGCVGGNVENVFLNDHGRIIAKAMSTSFGMGLGNFRVVETSTYVDTVGTPMYPYSVFEEVGLFDEELVRNQDDDFNFRVIKSGKKIFLNTDIKIKYYVRGNFKSLWRQFFQYGYWKVYVNKKHKSVTTLRQLVPPLFVLYLLLLPLTYIKLIFGLIATIPLVMYVILAKLIAWREKSSFSEFIGLIKTFPILHISYGLGYLKGIFHFFLLNKQPSTKEQRLSR